jgi:hypothetical protein
MTKIILNWKERLIIYLQNRKKKERQTEKEVIFESIMHLLTDNLSLEESIEMFQEVKGSFYNCCSGRLITVNKDKEVLENFLSV